MQVRKGCYMCNKLAEFTCKKCAGHVCREDYDMKSGLCGMCMIPKHINRK